MKLGKVFRKGVALLLALLLALSTIALSEEAVEPAAEIAVEEPIEPAEAPIEEIPAAEADEPAEEAELPIEEETPAEEAPAEAEPAEQPVVAPEAPVEDAAPEASIAVTVELEGEGALRAMLQVEGAVEALAYRWQALDSAAYLAALEAGEGDPEALWFDIEGADGAVLDAASAMGEDYARYSYRCAVTAGDLAALSNACSFSGAEVLEGEFDAELIQPNVLKPDCKHDFKDYSSEDDVFEEPMIEDIIEITSDTHTVSVWVVTGKKCSKCGYFSEYNIALKTQGPEKHKYDSSGACSICSKVCNHEKATKREWVRAYSGDYFQEAISDTQHAAFMDVQQAVECPTCHKTLDNNGPALTHLAMSDPEPHDFDDDGRCTTCGYKRAGHEHVFNFDGPDVEIDVYYDSYVPSADGSKCIGKGKTTFKAAQCEEEYCNEYMYKMEYDANAQDEMDHVKSDEHIMSWGSLNGLCAHCRAVKVCDHEHTIEFADEEGSAYTDLRSEDILLYGGEVTSNGNGTHTGKLVRTIWTNCLDCGAQRVRKEVIETTEHCRTYDGKKCFVCGSEMLDYVGMCDHPEEMRKYFPSNTGTYEPCEGGHRLTEADYKFYCSACGLIEDADERRPVEGTAVEPHVYRIDEYGSGSDGCMYCGAYPECDNHEYVPDGFTNARFVQEGYTRKDMKTHIHVYGPCEYAYQKYKCENCGWIKIDETKELKQRVEGYSVEEPHTWLEDGICAYCNEFFVCDHSAVTKDLPIVSTRKAYIDDPDATDGMHIVRVMNTYKCPECKRNVELPDETQDVREPHVFDTHGLCTLCGHSDYYTEIKFLESKLKMGKGEKIYSGLSVYPRNGAGEITFKSSKTKVAQVDAQGVITAKATGKAKITATCKTPNGQLTAEMNIEVAKKPKNLKLDNYLLDMGLNETYPLTATPPSGSGAITWSSDNEAVATVRDGAVTAVAKGSALICAKISDGVAAFCRVTVKDAPTAENVALNLERSVFGAGEKAQATVTYTDAAGACKFESSATSVATVDPKTGAIVAVSAGDATITATTYNDIKLTKQITVKPAPTKLIIEKYQNKLGLREEWQLRVRPVAVVNGQEVESAGAVTFSTSKGSVISVDKNTGMLTGKKKSSAKITAKAYNGKKASVSIKVMSWPTDFKFKTDHATIGVGETGNLYDLFTPVFGNSKQYGHVDWASHEEWSCVKIDGDQFTGVGVGSDEFVAAVYWEYMDGKRKYANFTVNVKEAPVAEGMHLDPPRTTLGVGETIGAGFTYDEQYGGSHSFSTGNKNIATVDAKTGDIKGKKAGKTSITVKAYNGASVQREIEVVAKPTKVSLQNKVTKLGVGETWQLGAKVMSGKTDTTGKVGCTFTSNKPDVLAVNSETGELTALKAGKAKITVKTYNKKSASVTIQVVATPTLS